MLDNNYTDALEQGDVSIADTGAAEKRMSAENSADINPGLDSRPGSDGFRTRVLGLDRAAC